MPVTFAAKPGLQFGGLEELTGAINGPHPAYLMLHLRTDDIGKLNTH